MKQVVQEILHGNKTVISKPVQEKSSSKPTSNNVLKNINRPNYQQKKKNHRLKVKENVHKPAAVLKNTPTKQRTNNRKELNEKSISKLNSITLAEGNLPKRNNNYIHQNQRYNAKSRLIGKTKNGGFVWFYPELSMDLIQSFQRPLDRVAVGVIQMPNSLPSYLLLVNEVIRQNQDIKFHVMWDSEANSTFTAELYDEDVGRLERIMNDLYQKLNRNSMKRYETYTAISPSSWLSRQLKASPSVEAIAFLEGISYYNNIILVDQLLEKFAANEFQFYIHKNYILFEGNYHIVSKLIGELKKLAAHHFSAM
ncbi:hypothetical protein [Ornithinibacillus halophilus]|nr:hypothetical protein [Ornithinibacillus halophilus]